MILDKLDTLDLYLNYPAKTIIQTKMVEDYCCGTYNCYYIVKDGYLEVSTSAAELIKNSKSYVPNPNFCPNFEDSSFVISHKETFDTRVIRLQPFEKRTVNSSVRTIEFTRDLGNTEELIEKSIIFFKENVHWLETKYPEHKHILLTGGRDSQLMHLVPKLNDHNWYTFSAEPNAPLVKEWMKRNDIYTEHFFYNDNGDDDGEEFLVKKIINGDLMINPIHHRFSRDMVKIAEQFKGKCFFWLGTMHDRCNIYRLGKEKMYQPQRFDAYWERHLLKAGWADHQLKFNLTNCPVMSLYDFPNIWKELYCRFNPPLLLTTEEI